MPHSAGHIRQNSPLAIQLFNLTEHTVELPKGTYVGICDVALKVAQIFTVDVDPTNSSSPRREDLACLNLAKNAQRRTDPPVSADDLPLRDLDAAQIARVKDVIGGFEHVWYPEYQGRCNITEHHIDIVSRRPAAVFATIPAGLQVRKVIQETLNDTLDKNIIQPSK